MNCAICHKPATREITIKDQVPVGSGQAMTFPRIYNICDEHDVDRLVSINGELRERKGQVAR